MSPGRVAALISQTADPQACPDPDSLPTQPATATDPPRPYLSFLGVNSGAVQQCQGGPGHNSSYGTGQVDAFNAVTHASGSGG